MTSSLNNLQKYFINTLKLTPIFGAEIEFYLHDIKPEELERAIGLKIKPEKGENQFEINLMPSSNAALYATEIVNTRSKIIETSAKLGGRADFSPKPFASDYGSALHIHLNFKEDENIEKYAKMLCHFLPETLHYFLPKNEDFIRLDSNFMAPTHISYGGNNRTTMIRIPDSLPKRLEHRLPGANADPASVIYAMLSAIKMGHEQPKLIKHFEKTHGNAYDAQYGLEEIKKLSKATKLSNARALVKKYAKGSLTKELKKMRAEDLSGE